MAFGKKKKKKVNEFDDYNLGDNHWKHDFDELGSFDMVTKKKKRPIKDFIQKYDFTLIQKEIESYGYKYSFKSFALAGLAMAGIIIAVALYTKVRTIFILGLIIELVLMIPFIVRSQFDEMYQIKRFDMVTSYLDNIIPIFKKNPSIVKAWEEMVELTDGEMRSVVYKAYDLVKNNTDDPNVYKSAFKVIEERFPNSRIHSVHQMMYTVETQNTVNYTVTVDNMWIDVQAWITRVTNFHESLRKRKQELMMLCLLTLAANCLFVTMYSANEVFSSFTDNIVYQISTTIFMGAVILVMVVFQIRLNGKWLLDDKTVEISKDAVKSFRYFKKHKTPEPVGTADKVLCVFFVIAGVAAMWLTGNSLLALGCAIMAYMVYTTAQRTFNNHKRVLGRYLEIEFPQWMRDISINLHNLTVTNAIEASKTSSSAIMNYYIDELTDDVYEHPTSIRPFNDFLAEFEIQGVRTAMKMLYSIQDFDQEETQKQTNALILRNQEMLDHAEKIKNEAAVSGLRLLGFAPVALLIVQMLVNMALLFWFMLTLMGNAIQI